MVGKLIWEFITFVFLVILVLSFMAVCAGIPALIWFAIFKMAGAC
jgi:hypothetical protein